MVLRIDLALETVIHAVISGKTCRDAVYSRTLTLRNEFVRLLTSGRNQQHGKDD
jgi:hypothetical protein